MPLPKRERFINKLNQQIEFIQRSCEAYDRGLEDESLRIATSLRVIFHETAASTSLIKHLKFDKKKMLSSAAKDGKLLDFLSWKIALNSPVPVSTIPILSDKFRELSIHEWWSDDSIFTFENKNYSRRSIILNAANKDGGTHVDEKLAKFYEALSSGIGVDGISITGNLEFDGKPPFEQGVNHSAKNIHFALIRQFAHEFILSVRHFKW